jgi:hypothetical protein
MERSRSAVAPTFGGLAHGHTAETRACNTFVCPTNCGVISFGKWSPCTKSCGTGSQKRDRVNDAPKNGGKACPHSAETRNCNAHACPVDCVPRSWQAYSACTKSCGTGSQKRSRAQVEPTFGGKACPHYTETRTCNTFACPANCNTGSWSPWATCTKTCGNGVQDRSRATIAPKNGGKSCPHSAETRACNAPACAVDCAVPSWGAYSACTKSCGTGSQKRSRATVAPKFGGKACPHSAETRNCNAHACPVDCATRSWKAYSTCTKSCGAGSQKRSRAQVEPTFGGKACPHYAETRACNEHACPVDCAVSAWEAWSTCTASCGTGSQKRSRVTVAPTFGGKACPHSAETRACNTFACAVNCQVVGFGDWSTCTATCNGGSQQRTRPNVEPTFGGKACPHSAETQACNMWACACDTVGGTKAHGARYAGFGKNFCNQCRCHAGKEMCTKRACAVHSTAQLCASTACRYGVRFGNTDDILSTTQALEAYGASWSSMQHEFTTVVQHHHTDANGAKFSCGHVMHTDMCKCYCSNAGNHHIWLHTKRHADTIKLGLTSAGCKCQTDWSHRGKNYNGCANPNYTPNPLLDTSAHGEKREAWCKIVPGSCSLTSAVKAGNDWDTCSDQRHLHIVVPLL